MRDRVCAMAFDKEGNIYFTGRTNSANLPFVNAFQNAGEVFLVKLPPAGRTVLLSTYIGVEAATRLGGRFTESAKGIKVGNDGTVYIAGKTHSTDLPTTSNGYVQTRPPPKTLMWDIGRVSEPI